MANNDSHRAVEFDYRDGFIVKRSSTPFSQRGETVVLAYLIPRIASLLIDDITEAHTYALHRSSFDWSKRAQEVHVKITCVHLNKEAHILTLTQNLVKAFNVQARDKMDSEVFTGSIKHEHLPEYPLLVAFLFPAEECFNQLLDLFLIPMLDLNSLRINNLSYELLPCLCAIISKSFAFQISPPSPSLLRAILNRHRVLKLLESNESTPISWANVVTSAVNSHICKRYREKSRHNGRTALSRSLAEDENKENIPTYSQYTHSDSQNPKNHYHFTGGPRKPLSLLYEISPAVPKVPFPSVVTVDNGSRKKGNLQSSHEPRFMSPLRSIT